LDFYEALHICISGGGGHLVRVPTLFIPKYHFGFSYLFFLTCFADGIMYYGPVV
jgi:hypothetical protein